MPRAAVNGIEIEYETFGPGDAPAVLLINGLGSQMTRWPVPFCDKLVARGYRAIRFDNRDVGRSTWFQSGDRYTLSDMAADAAGLLDHLKIDKAHIVGVSMGGMIAQTFAIEHPDRALSLTSIMSATGAPGSMDSTPEAAAVLTQVAPDPTVDEEAFVAHGMKNARTIGSPAYPWTDEALRERVLSEMRRAYNPKGVQRQRGAIGASGDRTEKLAKLDIPTVVLHGEVDPLIPKAGGEATARAIPGAELRIIPGMGHDLPEALYDTIIDAIVAAADRAR
ncbi:alpha/beta fold hydrolase [Phenylobacterium sp.]|uniref:alpha/beta fold hydrolase n=1 Tax=Phenylobacterium sp. TaxID=1871053 RepID=UPI0027305CF3|nr:alpha/beta hydrolase [Phenylobacterium sp.]MDP1618284.1 alpha/beta hydrolase [Phenylobacterium sp.]MDP1988324.1 alpha/beta hydrolase [Phenylobacterium sp.]